MGRFFGILKDMSKYVQVLSREYPIMQKKGTILSNQQMLLVQYIGQGMSIAEASRKLHLVDKTARRWLKNPHVQEALDHAQAQTIETVKQTAHEIIIKKYREALEPVTDAVVSIAKDSEAPASARLKAAQMIQDRLAPATTTNEQTQPQSGRYVDLNAWTMQEIERLDALLQEVENRQQAEQGVTPLRKVN
jgi:hypothetical protein